MKAEDESAAELFRSGRDVLWYKAQTGIGDRLHHLSTLIRTAERFELPFVIDMRDGMFAAVGEDAFTLYFTCTHPLYIDSVSWQELETATGRQWIPDEKERFRAGHYADHYLLSLPPIFQVPRLGSWLWNHLDWMDWISRKLLLGRRGRIYDVSSRREVSRLGSRLPLEHRGKGRMWLFFEVVRPIPRGGLDHIRIQEDLRLEIAQSWTASGLSLEACVGIHVRQTDKSSSNWWMPLLQRMARGEVFNSMRHVYLATDSRRVVEAFQQANLRQKLHVNPWIELETSEMPPSFIREPCS